LDFLRQPQQAPAQKLGGRYQVIDQLGVGGFSQTFLAQDLHLPGRPCCVVKQFKPKLNEAAHLRTASRLFDTEATVLYQLGEHAQIPRLLAHFEQEQEFYLVQEFIEGQPLSKLLHRAWTEQEVIGFLQDLLQILSFVHQQGVIHRDIKPSNLMYRQRDRRLVLIDFGAVKRVSTPLAEASAGPTVTIAIGTEGYMPMEQLSGNPRFNSDIYAAGVVAIQLMTGISPKQLKLDFQTGELNWQNLPQLEPKLEPKLEPRAPISPAFAAILDRMVRYHFKDRYQTVGEILQALETLTTKLGIEPGLALPPEALLEEPIQADPTSSEAGEPALASSPDLAADRAADRAHDATPDADSLVFSTALMPDLEPASPTTLPILEPLPELTVAASPVDRHADRSDARLSFPPARMRWILGIGVAAMAVALAFSQLQPQLRSAPSSPATAISNLPCQEPPPPPLPSDPADYQYPDGTRYYGATQGGLPVAGRAIMVFPSGTRYDGEFANGQRNGCGRLTFANGRSYMGQFKADQFQGQGVWTLENGDRYVGEFQNNRCQGQGTFIFADGSLEQGKWLNGKSLKGDLECDR
jgi:serine/threonine protein kinase